MHECTYTNGTCIEDIAGTATQIDVAAVLGLTPSEPTTVGTTLKLFQNIYSLKKRIV